MFKKLALALLLAYIVEHTPWRLLALLGETLVVKPGRTQVVKGTARYWDVLALEMRLAAMGWTISYDRHLHGGRAYGLTDNEAHTIQIDADLEWDARYSILAHEGGHALQSAWEWVNEEDGEAFAESVAYLVAQNGVREHARYLSTHKLALLSTIVFKADRVYRAAALLQE